MLKLKAELFCEGYACEATCDVVLWMFKPMYGGVGDINVDRIPNTVEIFRVETPEDWSGGLCPEHRHD